jgi:hypothetical protein
MAADDEGRLWSLALAALIVTLSIPFFLVDLPPVLDYPNHLAQAYVLAFGASNPVLSAMYAPHWTIFPNLAVDIIGPPLLHLFPVHIAGRLLLAGALFLPVIGAIAYHRTAFGVRSYWPLAAGLAGFNGIFFLGFLNLLYGVGFALLGAALWIRNRERAPVAVVLGGAASTTIVFFCHIFAVLFFALLIGSQELARIWRLKRGAALTGSVLWRAALLLALALAPAVILFAFSNFPPSRGEPIWDPVARKLFELFVPFMTYSKPLTLLTGLSVVAVIILVWRKSSVDPGSLIAVVLLFAVYVVAPGTMNRGAYTATRLPLMIGLLLFAGFQPGFPARQGRVVAAGLALLLIVRSAVVGFVWHEHRQDVADVRRAISGVEAGARVLVASAAPEHDNPDYLLHERWGRSIPDLSRIDLNMGGLLVIERSTFWPALAADPTLEPLKVLPPYDRIAAPNAEPPDYAFLAVDRPPAAILVDAPYLTGWQANFDYVLLLNAGAAPDLASFLPGKLQLMVSTDEAALFKIRR